MKEKYPAIFISYKAPKELHDKFYKREIGAKYIIENTEYDQNLTNNNIYNVYGTIMQHYAVCEGYSKSMKYLLDAANIPCVIVCGVAQNSNGQAESHAWNYVKLDDKWYAIDATWDDPVIIGYGYVSNSIYAKYFLKGSSTFNQDHVPNGRFTEDGKVFTYPIISSEDYN